MQTRLANPQRILNPDYIIQAGSYVRVHCHPKRFPACAHAAWATRIVAATAEFVVLNKPVGVPVPPTVDNILECVATQATMV